MSNDLPQWKVDMPIEAGSIQKPELPGEHKLPTDLSVNSARSVSELQGDVQGSELSGGSTHRTYEL